MQVVAGKYREFVREDVGGVMISGWIAARVVKSSGDWMKKMGVMAVTVNV